ncbi:MAG: hypothetical protein QW775_00615 [Ignisphaera sp.]
MSKIVLSHTVYPVIPLAGIPFKGYGNIFLATKIPCKCYLRVFYKLTRCRGDKVQNTQVQNQKSVLLMHINRYINVILSELYDMCAEGDLEIKCDCYVPDIVAFVASTTDVLFNLFNVKRMEYEEYLKMLAVLDNKYWFIESPYIAVLRCAYAYQGVCICRDIHESVKLRSFPDIELKFLGELKCGNSMCLEITSPFDVTSTSYILKYTSHVISQIAQDLVNRSFIAEATLKHLSLLYDIETRTVVEVYNNMDLEMKKWESLKPVPDINSVKFYGIRLKSVKDRELR